MTRPAYFPGWDATGNRSGDFDAGMKASGWEPGMKPGAEERNELDANFSDWIEYLDAAHRSDTLEAFIDGTAEGDVGIVHENDANELPGHVHTSGVTLGADVVCMAVDGRNVIASIAAGNPRKMLRESVGTLSTTYTKSNAGNTVAIVTDGVHVAVAYGNFVELFTVAGVSVWDYDHGAAVADVCMDAERVFIVGADPGAGEWVECLARADGSQNWTYDPGSSPAACCCDGRRLYLTGLDGATSSVFALNAQDGSDSSVYSWSVADSGGAGTKAQGSIATDGRMVVVGLPTTASDTLLALSCGDGATLWAITLANGFTRVAIDDDYVAAIEDAADDVVRLYDKRTGGLITVYVPTGAIGGGIALDGTALFVGTGNHVKRVHRGNSPKVWRRVDPSTEDYSFLPHRRLAVAQE